MLNGVPDLHVTGAGSGGQFFPRYTYELVEPPKAPSLFDEHEDDGPTFRRVDNVTDRTLFAYQATYGPAVTKDDIFFYVYGLLHSPAYREWFGADLKKSLPRIPKVEGFH
jgi:predicted helicase